MTLLEMIEHYIEADRFDRKPPFNPGVSTDAEAADLVLWTREGARWK